MKTREELIGKCGIYCGTCRPYLLKTCRGCLSLSSSGESGCPYTRCLRDKGLTACGRCLEFPCGIHYGPMAVYSRTYLDWKKEEIEPRPNKKHVEGHL